MSELLKRRLTGAAVLLLLAGLAWPLLFNFDESALGEAPEVDIPAAPDMARDTVAGQSAQPEPVTVEEPTLAERLSAEAEELLESSVEAGAAGGSALLSGGGERDQPRLDSQRIPVSYVIQVATFNDWNNARNFRESLLGSGFKAYVKPPGPAQQGPYRIAVGPVLTYAEAEKIARRIEDEHRIMDAIIRRLRDV